MGQLLETEKKEVSGSARPPQPPRRPQPPRQKEPATRRRPAHRTCRTEAPPAAPLHLPRGGPGCVRATRRWGTTCRAWTSLRCPRGRRAAASWPWAATTAPCACWGSTPTTGSEASRCRCGRALALSLPPAAATYACTSSGPCARLRCPVSARLVARCCGRACGGPHLSGVPLRRPVRHVVQAVPSIPESVLLLYGGAAGAGDASGEGGLFLQIALQNGVLMRTEVRGFPPPLPASRPREVSRSLATLQGCCRTCCSFPGLCTPDPRRVAWRQQPVRRAGPRVTVCALAACVRVCLAG